MLVRWLRASMNYYVLFCESEVVPSRQLQFLNRLKRSLICRGWEWTVLQYRVDGWVTYRVSATHLWKIRKFTVEARSSELLAFIKVICEIQLCSKKGGQ